MLGPYKLQGNDERQHRFMNYLMATPLRVIVSQGKEVPYGWNTTCSEAEAKSIIERFLKADRAWMMGRHGHPMLYHFACRLDKTSGVAYLEEYLDEFMEEKQHHYKRILEILGLDGIHTLVIPLKLDHTLYEGYEFHVTDTCGSVLGQKFS